MEPKIKPDGACTFHRDGTVSYWHVYQQQWRRAEAWAIAAFPEVMSTLSDAERGRIERLAKRHPPEF